MSSFNGEKDLENRIRTTDGEVDRWTGRRSTSAVDYLRKKGFEKKE
jgi:hypothetical protein